MVERNWCYVVKFFLHNKRVLFTLVDFARSNGALVSKDWKDTVTHVIAATYSNGVCLRTLKVLMDILNGKWIVTMEWLKAYVEA
ncbi:hypothetical protein L1987_88030 [Smallanthus sonchifolius]|nr:hypothetical protein L1987_88030 [Smallanthus sonchifolius]